MPGQETNVQDSERKRELKKLSFLACVETLAKKDPAQ
jgi:hypothetical protein